MNNPFEIIDQRLSNIENLLLDIKHPQRPPAPSDRCKLSDACEITGLSKAAIYKLTSEKKLPHSKFGSRLIFSRRQLSAWVEQHTVPPSDLKHEVKETLARAARKHMKHETK